MMSANDPLTYFRLKPIRSARVSEISETTAAAPVAAEDRVNFHIGNPLQDPRLSSAFLRIALGLEVQRGDLRDADPDALREALGWDKADKPKLEFLIRTIQKSSPYMPRGGYARKTPNAVVKAFAAWLENQQEALRYDTGEQSARREIILASGGIHEALRVLLWALSSYLEITPARVWCYHFEVLPVLREIPGLIFEDLSADEWIAREQIEQSPVVPKPQTSEVSKTSEVLHEQPETPTFLLLGEVLSEEGRRWLRRLSTKRPLFFIEVNNAPNHLSLAREAKLVQRVIRLLTPAIFAPHWGALSTVFIAGNADILNAIENVHFNLKGTPSASEIEFLSYLLEHHRPDPKKDELVQVPQVKPSFEGLALGVSGESALPQLAERIEHYLDRALNDHTQVLDRALSIVEQKAAIMSQRVQQIPLSGRHDGIVDEFATVEARELFAQMIDSVCASVDQPAWNQSLQRSFLGAFVRHQPQYRPEACVIASGSSRTALGIVGFHCGITDVVIPDLSWSYEQCFPNVHAVPLTPALELDADGLIAKIEELCVADPTWHEHGAVAVNNPHNATGRIFAADVVRKLITYCLERGITVVDDLAYQNVAPVDGLPVIKTARQHAEDLVHEGILTDEQADRVLTVHSMSKTDCLAGARLAVVEIRDAELRERFEALNAHIQPNLAAIFICYLFYRSGNQAARTYWHWRNAIFAERTQALLTAVNNLPPDRNPFGLAIIAPTGSMYPLLRVTHLPAGLSLDWLASSLARTGIGLLPLATFARTEKGFETGRTTFRLTLGGVDGAEILLTKTRRLLIDLNRLIAEEEARYNRRPLKFNILPDRGSRVVELTHAWDEIAAKILRLDASSPALQRTNDLAPLDAAQLQREFVREYVPQRLAAFRTRLLDRALISDELMAQALSDNGEWLAARLDREFMKDSLERRQKLFAIRSYDRTVHPTQMYGLPAEMILDTIVAALVARRPVEAEWIDRAAQELAKEFLGQNVAITSENEADEILLDLGALIAGEDYAGLFTDAGLNPILSFWSDWDGSNRPSGQGHRLAAAVVMENVRRLSRILALLREADHDVDVEADLLKELEALPKREERFTKVLNEITSLTHQLEQRYRSLLPYSTENSWAVRLHVKRDPAKVMWQHNDRYERKMLELRQQRREMLEDYFALNKRLRKQLHALIPAIQANRTSEKLLREVVGYRDILQRTVITPRIGQGLITARDQFAINTTVFNLNEINAIAGKYGNPGLMLAMQVSLSTNPEALISLDRKLRIQHEQTQREFSRREYPGVELPWIWLIPLFEDLNSITNLRPYLDRVWEYAAQSHTATQAPPDRFAEIITEVFIAGSDLSQQVSQARSAFLYRQAKYDLQAWAAERQVAEVVRIKLGSGEPMQRQGGYYSRVAGEGAFIRSEDNRRRFAAHLPAAARRSTAYAVTPLQGIFLGRDLRTFQSNLSEELRLLPVRDFVALLYHVREAQHQHRRDLIRAAESIAESRLSAQSRSVQELERLTIGMRESLYEGFLEELTENFRHILYGREEDVIGIHAISYFIGRSSPVWRDRPTSRRTPGSGADRSQQILANIAEIIPLSKQGSLLRAIAHNQAQTVVLGINQLTTGLFRALERFAQKSFAEAERERLIAERILPHLPVYEILSTLRLYQDWNGDVLKRIEPAFPAGNSAFVALREDSDARQRYLPLFQQELLRRHGVNVNDFFVEGVFIPELLPTLRPDLAVLLQSDLSNTSIDQLLDHTSGRVDDQWRSTTTRLLQQPRQIQHWRSIIWDVMGDSIYQRVQSFTELATALYAFSANRSITPAPAAVREAKLSPKLSGFFRSARADDEMRNFLLGALEYLGSVTEGNVEVPVAIIRAMNDVERLAQIEESALPAEKQDVLRHCLLQIARLTGENG
jgi:aspartate/methionine/tyrosine aminotransferase